MISVSKFAWVACFLLLPAFALAQFTNCSLPPHNATTILDLRPGDVKVMMAMGDSITTGFGVHASINETYGASFSIGGDLGATTLANLFHYFNPNVVGYSSGTYPAEVCYGSTCPAFQYDPTTEQNNAAKSGAMVVDMVNQQVTYLIRQMNQNPLIDVLNDWKVLTIFIGVNDLCASCAFDLPYLNPDDYQNNLMATLERVRSSIPRTFVNLVGMYNVSQAYDVSLTAGRCANLTRSLFIECDCIFDVDNGPIRETIDANIAQFNVRAQEVAQYYQSKAYNNFAVIFQPFAMNTYLTSLPESFLSHLDCFHPSRLGQQAMAIALWNNMLSPSIGKHAFLDMDDTPMCPTADTLLYTY